MLFFIVISCYSFSFATYIYINSKTRQVKTSWTASNYECRPESMELCGNAREAGGERAQFSSTRTIIQKRKAVIVERIAREREERVTY